jgi:hypothetical protein
MLKPLATTLAGLFLLALAWAPLEADDPVSSSVSFNREVVRIIQRKCEPCHAPGGLAMSLSDYRDARAWGRAIREELVEHRMPPAIVARGYRRYESDPSLNAREMATFLTWLDGGMPRGELADRPPAPRDDESAGPPDPAIGTRLALPLQVIPAAQDLVVRRVTIDAAAARGRAIARVQLRPGNRRVVRGALVSASPAAGTEHDARWVGAWLPWQHVLGPPASHAFHLDARSNLSVELYYRGADTETTDQSAIDVTFAPPTAAQAIDDVVVNADAGVGHRLKGSVTLSRPTTVWAIQPSFGPSAKSVELRAERPDTSIEVLVWIPEARPDWPVALVLQEPVTLPAGTIISLVVETGPAEGARRASRATLSVLR